MTKRVHCSRKRTSKILGLTIDNLQKKKETKKEKERKTILIKQEEKEEENQRI